VVVVQHWKESRKPTSTGSLLAKLLSTGSLKLHAHRDHPFDPSGLDTPDTWLVFPTRDGTHQLPSRPPRQLVLLDGNWNQASRMARRIPAVAALPRMTLTDAVRPVHRLRAPPDAAARSTMEAAAAALRYCGAHGAADRLEWSHDRFVAATLEQRGIRGAGARPPIPR